MAERLTMNDKKMIYINLALILILVFIVTSTMKTAAPRHDKTAVPRRGAYPARSAKDEKAAYDIGEVKGAGTEKNKAVISNLEDVFKNYSKEDAGDNMAEEWTKVSAEDKAKFMDGIKKEIEKSKQSVAADPKDKRAKGILKISESLKKAAELGFNYDLKEGVSGKKNVQH